MSTQGSEPPQTDVPPPRLYWETYRVVPRPVYDILTTGLAILPRLRQLITVAHAPETV